MCSNICLAIVIAAAVLLVACSDDATPAIDAASGLDSPVTVSDLQSSSDQSLADQTLIDKGASQDDAAVIDTGAKPDHAKPPKDSGSATCAAQNAHGQGACEMLLGWGWDGRACVPLSGCSCQGPDCSKLFADPGACYKVYGVCIPCTAMDAQGQGACKMLLGWKWDGSQCVSFGGCSCLGTDCDRVFGSAQICQAAMAHCP